MGYLPCLLAGVGLLLLARQYHRHRQHSRQQQAICDAQRIVLEAIVERCNRTRGRKRALKLLRDWRLQ